MEASDIEIHLNEEEDLLFDWMNQAFQSFRDKYKDAFPDLNGQTSMEDINFGMVCGGWPRDKVFGCN